MGLPRRLPRFIGATVSRPDLKLSLFLIAPPRPRPLLQSTNYTNFHELLPPPRPLFRTTNFAPDYNFGAEKLREFENCNVTFDVRSWKFEVQISLLSHSLPPSSSLLLPFNPYSSLVTDYRSLITDHCLPIIDYRSLIALFSNGPIGNIPGQFSQTGIAGAHNQDNFPAPWFKIYIRQELLPVCH